MSEFIGKKYGRLTIIAEPARRKPKPGQSSRMMVECQCDCGNEKLAHLYNLQKGSIKSCGCIERDRIASFSKKPSSI